MREDLVRMKEKLGMMRDRYKVNESGSTKESKQIAEGIISRQEKKSEARAKIRSLAKKIEESKFSNRFANKFDKGISKVARQIVKSRRVLKRNKLQVTIPEREVPSVLGDENRFFKGTYEQEKRSMFLS